MPLRSFLLSLAVVCSIQTAISQSRGLSRNEALELEMNFDSMDSLYQNAVNVDSTKAVFKTAEQSGKVHEEWQKLLQELGNHLKENDFEWEQPTDGFNRIYFDSDGSIDYFIFSFRGPGTPDEEREAEFKQLLNEFLADYKADLKADQKFSQCGGVRYMPQ